jgi:outer membrane protein TolC
MKLSSQRVASAIALATGLLAALPVSAGEGVVEIGQLDALIESDNQSLRAVEERAEASRLEATAAEEQWPQPMLEYMFEVGAPWAGHLSTGHMVQVMQRVPRRGAREALAEPARAEAALWDARRDAQRMDLYRAIRVDLIELARLGEQIALRDEEAGLLRDALAVVETRLDLGRADHSELFQLELARESALDERRDLLARWEARREELVARVGVDGDELELGGLLEGLLDEWLREAPRDLASVDGWVREHEPGLKAMEAEADVAASRVALVDQRLRPWPAVMVGYSNMPPMWEMEGPRAQMFQVGFSVELPVFRRQYDAEGARWQAMSGSALSDRSQAEEEAVAAARGVASTVSSRVERIERFQRELLPLAEDLGRQVLISMEIGERTASDLLVAVQQEVALQARLVDLRAALLTDLVELQRWTGGRFGEGTPFAYPQGDSRRDGGER